MTYGSAASLVLGVIGHVDHGKTALVGALTGMDTDRLAEEKQRGISIALGFAHLMVGDVLIDLIDMPGHERFVRTMISGATGIDAVLLVVAANEGVKPQTVEHVDIARLLGLRRAVVVVTKADLVPADEAALMGAEAGELLERAGFDPAPVVMTSALRGQGLEQLREALAALAASQRARDGDGLAFLPIDRAFAIAGHGPVVTGTLRGAGVAAGDVLELLPAGRAVRIRAVQSHGRKVDHAVPGQRVALNLRDVDAADLQRGMALAAPASLCLSDWLTMDLRALADAPPLKNGKRLRALFGTDEVEVRLRLLDRDVLEPGQCGFAQLHCARGVALPAGEHIVLRLLSPARTVAGGRLLEPVTRRQRRNAPAILQHLAALASLPPADLIAAEVARAGAGGTSIAALSRLSARAGPRVVELLRGQPVIGTRGGLVVARADFDAVLARIPAVLERHADGLTQDRLLAALAGVGAAVLDEALRRCLASGAVAKRGSQFCVPRAEADLARLRAEEAQLAQITEMLRQAGLTPPLPRDILADPKAKRAVDHLLRAGVILRAVDRDKGKELLFHRDAIVQAQAVLAPLLAAGDGLLVTEITAALGISRKFCMPLLDHLDATGFTRRVGDRRIAGSIG